MKNEKLITFTFVGAFSGKTRASKAIKKQWKLSLALLFSFLLLGSFFKLTQSQSLVLNPTAVEATESANSGGGFPVVVIPSHSVVPVGQAISVTTTLYNDTTDTCFGIPQFNMHVNSNPVNPSVFEPVDILLPVIPANLIPGDSLEVTFNITATNPGTATFSVFVSGEGSTWNGVGCVGPFYWTATGGISGQASVFEDVMTIYLPSLFRP